MIQHLTKENFKDFYTKNSLALVDFWAPWCGPCRMLTPELEKLSEEFKLAVGKVNVDEEDVLSEGLNISSIPTLFLFKDGNLVSKKIGYMPYNDLVSWIKEYE